MICSTFDSLDNPMERPQGLNLDILTSSSCVKDFRPTVFGNTRPCAGPVLSVSYRNFPQLLTCYLSLEPTSDIDHPIVPYYLITQDNFLYPIKRTQLKKRSD